MFRNKIKNNKKKRKKSQRTRLAACYQFQNYWILEVDNKQFKVTKNERCNIWQEKYLISYFECTMFQKHIYATHIEITKVNRKKTGKIIQYSMV